MPLRSSHRPLQFFSWTRDFDTCVLILIHIYHICSITYCYVASQAAAKPTKVDDEMFKKLNRAKTGECRSSLDHCTS